MKKEFEDWEPLKRPRHGRTAMERWKIVLEGVTMPYSLGQTPQDYLHQPYDRLVWEVVMPYVRSALRYHHFLLSVLSFYVSILVFSGVCWPKFTTEVAHSELYLTSNVSEKLQML
jgi:hypothetical protein